MTTTPARELFLTAYARWRGTQRLVFDLLGLSTQEQRACIAIRNAAWDDYCDARDGLKPGTNRARRVRLDQLAATNGVDISRN